MIPLEQPFRRATETDAPQLAELVNMAGDGLPLEVWTSLAGPGANPWEIGRARQAEKARDGQVVVADFGRGAVASLTGYRTGSEPVAVGQELPAAFRPLIELENLVLNTWYVNVLACYPEVRGRGIGSRLLRVAEEIARTEGLDRLSLIVASTNENAQRLYSRHGYSEIARRLSADQSPGADPQHWILLTKTLASGAESFRRIPEWTTQT